MSENLIETVELDELETVETVDPEEGEAIEEGASEDVKNMTIPEAVDEVLSLFEFNAFSPYAIHTVVNAVFELIEFDKVVRPQMMYNYSTNGMIVKGSPRKGSGVTYNKDEVRDFAIRYVTRTINK